MGTTSPQSLDGRIGVVGQQRGALLGRRPRQRRQTGTWRVLSRGWWRMGRLRSLPRNMLWLCHISEIDIEYAECRYAGGGIPVAARRAIPRAHPDYGDAGIYREGHRASSKAKPRRDATFVPRSSERLICRCRGQIRPESDGAQSSADRIQRNRCERRNYGRLYLLFFCTEY